jgi:hypothetical protein
VATKKAVSRLVHLAESKLRQLWPNVVNSKMKKESYRGLRSSWRSNGGAHRPRGATAAGWGQPRRCAQPAEQRGQRRNRQPKSCRYYRDAALDVCTDDIARLAPSTAIGCGIRSCSTNLQEWAEPT